MKKFTSIFAGLLTLTMLFSVNIYADDTDENAETAETAIFTDVSQDTDNYESILKMYEAGYIKGYNDGSFKPNGNITRAELVVMLNNLFGYNDIEEYTKTFTDVNEANWFYDAVMRAGTAGYIAGFPDGSFMPNDNFTRQQFCVVLSQINDFQELEFENEIEDEVSPWASDYVYKVLSNRVMFLEDGNTFRATENITRSEVCAALAGFITDESLKEATTTEEDVTTVTETDTETTTKRTSSGGGGGGGSSSSSSSSSSTTTTETTTAESTTEATTSSSSSSSNGSTSNGSTSNGSTSNGSTSGSSDITTETTTNISINDVTLSADEVTKLKKIINGLQDALGLMDTNNEKALCRFINNSMVSYLDNSSYNIQSDVNEAKAMYNELSSDEKDDFKNCVLMSIDLSTLSYFAELFGII